MPRGPTVPVDTCLGCGNDTVANRENGLRHRLQLVDAPDTRGGESQWGQLCPACWTAMKHFLQGATRDDVTAPPIDAEAPTL